MDIAETFVGDVGVDLGGDDILVAKKFLNKGMVN